MAFNILKLKQSGLDTRGHFRDRARDKGNYKDARLYYQSCLMRAAGNEDLIALSNDRLNNLAQLEIMAQR